MAWGVGTTKADAQAYEVGLETEADVDSTGFYLDDAVGPTMEFDAPAWYGEDETYGTQSDWLTGEGLTTVWGNDPKDRISSTYANKYAEEMGEDSLANFLLGSREMLKRGGKPGPWDYAALGLSFVPIAGPAAARMATPFVKNTLAPALKNVFGRKYKSVIDRTPNVDDIVANTKADIAARNKFHKDIGLTLQGDDLGYYSYAESARNSGHRVLSRSEWDALPAPTTRDKMFDVLKSEFPESWAKATKSTDLNALVNEIRGGRYPSFDETMKLSDAGWSVDEISQLLDESVQNTSLAKFLASSKLPPKSDALPKNVAQLPGTKPIQDMTWREWDDLSDAPFQLSSKQHGMMKAQGITAADDVLDHFWGKGARNDFVGWLDEAMAKGYKDFAEEIEFIRLRDLKSGYLDEMTPAQLSKDIAWKGTSGSVDHLAVAEKMAWRPDSISHQDWARFTKDMTMKEVERAARKLALRIVD